MGCCLAEQLAQYKDIDILALDVQGLDITNQQAVEQKVQEFKPDIIINAAAHTAVDKAETDKDKA